MDVTSKRLKLSALDQSPIRSGGTAADTLRETIALAQACERAGYHRYWLAEHHASASLAGPAPEIMIGQVAATTSRIRVGSGGVMLSHYSPLKVAEQFSVLETLHPGRIDLGIGRAPGSDQLTAVALAYGSEIGIEYFPSRVADLMAFFGKGEHPTEIFQRIHMSPKPEHPPELWMLGSSDQSALLAAHFGLAFSFAQFITGEGGEMVLDVYRKSFKPSPFYPAPEANVCTFVVCAETEAEAERLMASRDLALLRRERGEFAPFPSVEEALAYPYSDQDRAIIARSRGRRRSIWGDPAHCRAALTEFAERHAVDEVVILTITHDPAARRRSYELLAEAFALADT
jgi:luciferase family oxidoreductase group 1